jgi:hypothetical protein
MSNQCQWKSMKNERNEMKWPEEENARESDWNDW